MLLVEICLSSSRQWMTTKLCGFMCVCEHTPDRIFVVIKLNIFLVKESSWLCLKCIWLSSCHQHACVSMLPFWRTDDDDDGSIPTIRNLLKIVQVQLFHFSSCSFLLPLCLLTIIAAMHRGWKITRCVHLSNAHTANARTAWCITNFLYHVFNYIAFG